MPKQTKKPQSKFTKLRSYAKAHKLVTVISVILLLLVGNFLYSKYLDWDNSQMIKGLSRDFPALVKDIEQATGLDLEIQSNCMQTTEKFSGGVSTCEYLVVRGDASPEEISKVRVIVLNSEYFGDKSKSENDRVYELHYRNKNSCTLSNRDRIYISCIVGVRDANKAKLPDLLAN